MLGLSTQSGGGTVRCGSGDAGQCGGCVGRTAVTTEVVLGLFWSVLGAIFFWANMIEFWCNFGRF